MGSCQNYGPFLGTLNNRCRIIIGTQKGTIILTTTHIKLYLYDIPNPVLRSLAGFGFRCFADEGWVELTSRFFAVAEGVLCSAEQPDSPTFPQPQTRNPIL